MSILKGIVYRAVAGALPVISRVTPNASSNAIGILMVHGVHDRSWPAPAPPSSRSLKSFATNLRAVRNTHSFISVDDAVAMLAGKTPWRKRCLVLTFDDSLKCLSEIVAPLLAELEIPAMFYISTRAIENQCHYWWLRLDYAAGKALGRTFSVELPQASACLFPQGVPEIKDVLRKRALADVERVVGWIESKVGASLADADVSYPFAQLMSWDDVRKLCKLGMDVGSHTLSHPNLGLLAPEDLRREVQHSRRIISDQTCTDCRHFSYPYGELTESVRAAVEAAGYSSAVAVTEGWNRPGAGLFQLNRVAMPAHAYKLAYLVSGVPQWLRN